jgi:hypothetical protein
MSGIAGFDSVELVIALEKTFRISIPDRDLEKLMSVADLGTYVAARIHTQPDSAAPCPTANGFFSLRRRVVSDSSNAAIPIRPSTPTAALLGAGDVREEWSELGRRLKLLLPPLCFGSISRNTIVALWLSSPIAAGIAGYALWGADAAFPCGAFAFLVSTIAFLAVSVAASKRWAKTIPPSAQTVGDLAYIGIIERKKASADAAWTEAEVQAVVRYLVAQNAGLPVRRIRQDTTFMELNAITG